MVIKCDVSAYGIATCQQQLFLTHQKWNLPILFIKKKTLHDKKVHYKNEYFKLYTHTEVFL